MRSDWQAAALKQIVAIHETMPDATVEDLRKELRRRSSDFHMGTSWGKKTWGKRCKLYLLGLNPTAPNPPTEWPADISFPFRNIDQAAAS